MKKALLYGKDSYIGTHIKNTLMKYGVGVQEVDSKTVSPNEIDFTDIDVVINVVGIAHIKIVPSMEELFYKINTDLAVELSRYAKAAGVTQYIYLSSMNVYGDTKEKICSTKQENPKNFYGRSKLQADQALLKMQTPEYKVVCVRPPVVYGKDCKGNFSLLAKLAQYMIICPAYHNLKSMIYIDNLTEFIYQCVLHEECGVFHPQNEEHTSTINIICEIRKVMKKSTCIIPGFGWLIRIMCKVNSKFDRAFQDDYYDLEFSRYRDNSYCKVEFEESIRRTINGD